MVKIKIPSSHRILSVGEQFGDVFLWAIVNNESELVEKKIYIFGTGYTLPNDINIYHFIGTVITDGGNYVWHIFEL
jgi:hypothetical protein